MTYFPQQITHFPAIVKKKLVSSTGCKGIHVSSFKKTLALTRHLYPLSSAEKKIEFKHRRGANFLRGANNNTALIGTGA